MNLTAATAVSLVRDCGYPPQLVLRRVRGHARRIALGRLGLVRDGGGRGRYPPVPQEIRVDGIEMRRRGAQLKDISAALGRDPSFWSRICCAAGVTHMEVLRARNAG